MRTRLMSSLILVAIVIPMAGCPGGASMAIGIWLVQFDSGSNYVGVEFLANGDMNEFNSGPFPVGANAWFEGMLTWQRRGNAVTILQDINGTIYTFAGTLENSTFMTGMWTDPNDPNNPKPFRATKAPSELIAP